MIQNKKVIIFDMDGTLIDSVWIWNAIDEQLIRTIGTKPVDEINIQKQRDDILKKFNQEQDPYLKYYEFLKQKCNSNFSKEEIKEIRSKIADQYLKEKVKYKPNAEKMLQYLKEKGYILAIGSTTSRKAIEIYEKENKDIIQKADLKEYFTVILTKDDVKKRKPDPEVHQKIMQRLKVKPEECLVIEDALMGVEAAKNAGIQVAVIEDQYADYEREKINQLADWTFVDFQAMLEEMKKELK